MQDGVRNKFVFVSLWVPVFAWMAAIFFLSSRPITDYPQVVPDYVAHLVEYSLLAALLWRALEAHVKGAGALAGAVVLTTFSYGLTDEIHQLFVATRTFSLFDLAVDTLAAVATVVAAVSSRLFFRRRRRAALP
ncbi:MAG: VanZ family protein [Terriglobia bacterium]